jgi:hypothetical protein
MSAEVIEMFGDESLAVQFLAKCAASWTKIVGDDDELATAMLVHSVNHLVAEHDERHVAQLLVGIAARLAPAEASAGHA